MPATAGRRRLQGLFELAEQAPRVPVDGAPPAFSRRPAWAAVVDEDDRPVGLLNPAGGAQPPLRVLPTERLADVTRRVASRPADDRHSPVVLCDDRARLVGLVTVERLLNRLADAVDAPCSTVRPA